MNPPMIESPISESPINRPLKNEPPLHEAPPPPPKVHRERAPVHPLAMPICRLVSAWLMQPSAESAMDMYDRANALR